MTSQKKPFLFWLMLITLIFVGLFAFATSLLSTAQAGVSAVPGGGVPDISLELFATGLSEPVSLANAGDSRLFVVEQEGIIRIVGPDGTVVGTPFLDITDRVEYGVGSEQGLLGLAFDPNFASNGYFYVNYTYCTISDCPDYGAETNLYTRISRFSVSADPNLANPASELVLISIQQPYGEHNGGDINFGPDGYLYIGMGDGGNADDPENHAQYGGDLLGKMLRIDVDGGGLPPDCEPTGNYTVPANNPFVGMADTCNEIWQMGTRNPWRFSFDQLTGDLYIADVGENGWEEVNFQPAGDSGGQNWGWRCYQGTHPHISDGCGPDADYDFPFFEYEQTTLRFSVIGG
ncbi:MAG: PQQ-dependent sugar dehydrogenase, partial [Anaerolineales bacterium]|nr:PQQ-dependent sugar dehydrogenase [Anaerolineales bacterium]